MLPFACLFFPEEASHGVCGVVFEGDAKVVQG